MESPIPWVQSAICNCNNGIAQLNRLHRTRIRAETLRHGHGGVLGMWVITYDK